MAGPDRVGVRIPEGTILDEETVRAAALVIAAHASDAGDARALLETCGMLPYEPGTPLSYSYGRRPK